MPVKGSGIPFAKTIYPTCMRRATSAMANLGPVPTAGSEEVLADL